MIRKVYFTLDVLTDGSEFTGNGTLFLSVWKQPPPSGQGYPDPCTEWFTINAPLARYAITGLGDATARLCADQRCKLAPTRAVFLPFPESWDGLASLLLAAHSAGSPSLHVVTTEEASNKNQLEELASIVLGPRRTLMIPTCHVPVSEADEKNTSWWKVYQDDYLTVHGTCQPPEKAGSSQTITFLYTIHQEEYVYTILLIPPHCPNVYQYYESLRERNLPVIQNHEVATAVDMILALNPLLLSSQPNSSFSSKDQPPLLFVTIPNSSRQQDPGILIRSQKVLSEFHHHLPWIVPYGATSWFSASNTPLRTSYDKESTAITGSDTNTTKTQPFYYPLQSCTSILWRDLPADKDRKDDDDDDNDNDKPEEEKLAVRHHQRLTLYDRRLEIWKREGLNRHDWSAMMDSLQTVQPNSSMTSESHRKIDDKNESNILDAKEDRHPKQRDNNNTHDDNEIELEGDDRYLDDATTPLEDHFEGKNNKVREKDDSPKYQIPSSQQNPYLIVLGTGCASPSAIRGTSGYALVFPTNEDDRSSQDQQMILLDCGEGVTTMLSRVGGDVNWFANKIVGLWISHAHLDHYGGLPTFIRTIHQESQRKRPTTQENQPRTKLAKLESSFIPWVMAPFPVLRFLDILLQCDQGQCLTTKQQLFSPRPHSQSAFATCNTIPKAPRLSIPSCIWFQNIQVYHSCCQSFGLLLGWRGLSQRNTDSATDKSNNDILWFCYSGDTRPCNALVQAYHRALAQHRNDSASQGPSHHQLLLLHEATFHEEERDQAISKKHSTISEAIRIAHDIPATRVILSHFSQRYLSLEAVTKRSCIPVGLAMDGCWISLASSSSSHKL